MMTLPEPWSCMTELLGHDVGQTLLILVVLAFSGAWDETEGAHIATWAKFMHG
jgi:hypothetical protein